MEGEVFLEWTHYGILSLVSSGLRHRAGHLSMSNLTSLKVNYNFHSHIRVPPNFSKSSLKSLRAYTRETTVYRRLRWAPAFTMMLFCPQTQTLYGAPSSTPHFMNIWHILWRTRQPRTRDLSIRLLPYKITAQYQPTISNGPDFILV